MKGRCGMSKRGTRLGTISTVSGRAVVVARKRDDGYHLEVMWPNGRVELPPASVAPSIEAAWEDAQVLWSDEHWWLRPWCREDGVA